MFLRGSAESDVVVATLQLWRLAAHMRAAHCATSELQANGGQMDKDFEQAELAYLRERDLSVSDDELVARMNSAPDLGGALLVELSAFVGACRFFCV